MDLSRLSLAEQIELNSFVGWSVLYSAAESLGGAIDTLRLPPAVVSCMLESIEAPDYRKSGCAGRRLLRSKPWICLIPGTDSARLSRRLWNEALSYIPSGSWIEYGPADARERLQVAAVDQFDLRENEFIGLARARERLQAGDVDGARLDVLSVGQWKQLGRDSSATFKCLMAMEMTSGNEEKFFELLSCLPNDESWPELDGPCRAAWVEGCEKAASSFELWREFIGTPLAWKRWDERSQLLRKLLGRHSRGDTRNPDKRELQSIGPLVPLRNTSPTVDAIAKRKEDVDKAAKSQHEWRGNLLALCQGDPVDVQALMTLLDELAESPHLPNGRKRDLLQEEFGGQTLLEHVGDGNVEALMELMARLQ